MIRMIASSTIAIAAAFMGVHAASAQGTPSAPAQPGTTAVPPSEPAVRQSAPAEPAGPPAPATETAQPAQTAPADPTSTAPAPAQQAAATPTANPQVVAFVDSQFPALDGDADGALTTTEFEGWIAKLKTAELQSSGKPVNDQEVKTYAQNAFLTADKDSDKKITKAEAAQFFNG